MRKSFYFAAFACLLSVCLFASGCAGKSKKGKNLDQAAAIGGEDIPLTTTVEGIEFSEIDGSSFAGTEAAKIFRDVHFAYNDSSVLAQDEPVLKDIAGFLNGNASLVVLVEGHCDERGTAEYNLSLGEKRALYVRSFLIALGVDAGRVHTISYGEEKPLAMGHDETDWRVNRRAHFMLAKE